MRRTNSYLWGSIAGVVAVYLMVWTIVLSTKSR